MRMMQHSVSLALAAGIWVSTTLSMAEAAPGVPPAMAEVAPREPILGVGYHPGNFVGPLAFDVILRALPHLAGDVQVGTWSLDNGVRALAVAPQLQWEFRRGWQTPHVGLGFRFEEVWSDGVTASSRGGFLISRGFSAPLTCAAR